MENSGAQVLAGQKALPSFSHLLSRFHRWRSLLRIYTSLMLGLGVVLVLMLLFYYRRPSCLTLHCSSVLGFKLSSVLGIHLKLPDSLNPSLFCRYPLIIDRAVHQFNPVSHQDFGHLARWGEWPVGASGPHGHLVHKDIWPVGASDLQGHLVRKDIWYVRPVGTSGPLGCLVRWDIWSVGTSGPLGRLVHWDIWSIGTSSPLGYPADDERLALVEHLAVKGRLVRHSNTSDPKGHLRQRERWYIWR
ncbi:hypothetical protein F2Q69_00001609 [Brassica cretica]|uniref:Uncharacterized protein n=1 Tax=Brassica cretica TaxID=69181 RepID=A0A8S9P9B3_BRACR|nr:hypothetical protein F2Q69_00001609 [Brassica cretica]